MGKASRTKRERREHVGPRYRPAPPRTATSLTCIKRSRHHRNRLMNHRFTGRYTIRDKTGTVTFDRKLCTWCGQVQPDPKPPGWN